WHGTHRGIGRRRELRTGPSPAPSSLGFSAGGLPLADHVRSHGPVPADLPDREPDDAVSVGLGVLAIPRPSSASHRSPAYGQGLAAAGFREVRADRRGRNRLLVVVVPDPGALHVARAIPERSAR